MVQGKPGSISINRNPVRGRESTATGKASLLISLSFALLIWGNKAGQYIYIHTYTCMLIMQIVIVSASPERDELIFFA